MNCSIRLLVEVNGNGITYPDASWPKIRGKSSCTTSLYHQLQTFPMQYRSSSLKWKSTRPKIMNFLLSALLIYLKCFLIKVSRKKSFIIYYSFCRNYLLHFLLCMIKIYKKLYYENMHYENLKLKIRL